MAHGELNKLEKEFAAAEACRDVPRMVAILRGDGAEPPLLTALKKDGIRQQHFRAWTHGYLLRIHKQRISGLEVQIAAQEVRLAALEDFATRPNGDDSRSAAKNGAHR